METVEGLEPQGTKLVVIGQQFVLFSPNNTREEDQKLLDELAPGAWSREYYSSLVVDSGLVAPFKMFPKAYRTASPFSTDFMAPFNPELGYTITGEDFSVRTRLEKILRMRKEGMVRRIYNKKVSAALCASSRDPESLRHATFDSDYEKKEFEKLGFLSGAEIWKHGLPNYPFKPEIVEQLKKIRLQLFFPNSQYEARLEEYLLNEGRLFFELFYPLDTGPLPVVNSDEEALQLKEGFPLHLPSDIVRLQQISAKFVLGEN